MDIKETEWYQTRPPLIQQRIDEYPPQYLYYNKPADQRVVIYSYEEGEDDLCNTCSILVLQKYNPDKVIFLERRVFGVPFDNLERLEQKRDVEGE